MEHQFTTKSTQKEQSGKAASSSLSQTAPAERVTAHPVLRLQRTVGNQAVQRMVNSGKIGLLAQPNVNGFGSKAQAPVLPNSLVLQRKCACGGTAESSESAEECAECQAKHETKLQRSTNNQASPADTQTAPRIVHDVLRAQGQPLDTGTRAFMEPRFGQDFSGVRIHTNTKAAESARAVNALAYTVGRDVVFGVGQYAPETTQGKRLLAHELTHVVQQKSTGTASIQMEHDPTKNQYDVTLQSINREFATHLSNEVLAQEIQHLHEQLLSVHPGAPEYETLRANLAMLEDEVQVRSQITQIAPFPKDVAVFVAFLVRGGYVYKVSTLLPMEWEAMTEEQLTAFLSNRFTEEELRKQFLATYAERVEIKALFRKANIVAALVIGLVWARENIRQGEWGTAAAKIGGTGVAAFALNRMLYARDLSAEVMMARKAGEFGRWFKGAARTNSFVNILLLWQLSKEFLMSGAGGGPNIPFDLIVEIDIDDPSTWREPDSTLLDFGFNLWYRQICTPAHPEACTPTPLYIAKVEGSAILGILKVLDIAPSEVPKLRRNLYRIEGDWGGTDLLIFSISGQNISADDNVLVVATGQRSGELVSGRGHYRALEVRPANEAAVRLFNGREPRFVAEYLLHHLDL